MMYDTRKEFRRSATMVQDRTVDAGCKPVAIRFERTLGAPGQVAQNQLLGIGVPRVEVRLPNSQENRKVTS